MTTPLSGPMLPPRDGIQPRRLMVLLHGYGADGNDLISLGLEWRQHWPDMLFVAPNAPYPCGAGGPGFEWFPLRADRIAGRIEGVATARPVIVSFLMDVWAQTGIAPADTVIAGFSQGAMMALTVGTSLDVPVAAIVAFSGAFTPPEGGVRQDITSVPIALIHGELDSVVDPQLSRDAAETLQRAGYEVALHLSPNLGHGISSDGLAFATSFLAAHLGASQG